MAFTPDFEYDVFLSYARRDDVALGNAPEGWVTKLCKDLRSGVGEYGLRDFNIFIDYEGLGANLPLTDQLLGTINRSAIFMLILSPAYVESEWCEREKSAFLDEIDPRSGRIFVVERRPPVLDPGDPPCPPPFDELVGVRFWNGSPPTPLDAFRANDDEWVDKVGALSRDVARQLKSMKRGAGSKGPGNGGDGGGGNGPGPNGSGGKPIFLAEVTPDLDDQRDLVKQYLSGFDLEVVPESYYPARDLDEFRGQVEADLAKTGLFVQLLGPAPDARTHLQFECAQEAGKELLVWRDPDKPLDRIRDPKDLELLSNDHVRSQSLKDFEKAAKEAAQAPPPPTTTSNPATQHGFCIFVHVDPSDLKLADVVMDVIEEHEAAGIELASVDSELESERTSRQLAADFEAFLVEADALVLIRGHNDGWVQRQWLRLRRLMPKVLEKRARNLPVAVYDGPPSEREKIRLRDPNWKVLDCRQTPQELDSFLDSLAPDVS